MHPYFVHTLYQKAHGLGHYLHVGALHRDNNILKVQTASHAEVLQTTLYHSLGSVAITPEHPLTKGAVIHSQSDGSFQAFSFA